MMHLYSALLCIAVHPEVLYNHVGGSLTALAFIIFDCRTPLRWIWWVINVQMEMMAWSASVWSDDEQQIVFYQCRKFIWGEDAWTLTHFTNSTETVIVLENCVSKQQTVTSSQRNAAHCSQFYLRWTQYMCCFIINIWREMTINAEKSPKSNIYYGIRINRAQEMSFIQCRVTENKDTVQSELKI